MANSLGGYRIDSLRLKNVRCFERFEIQFEPDLTVLTGDNAAGKTTIIEAIAAAVSTPLEKIPHASSKSLRASDVRETVRRIGSSYDRQVHYPASYDAAGIFYGEHVGWSRSLTRPGQTRMTIADAKDLLGRAELIQDRVASSDQELVLPIIALYGTDRLWESNTDRRSKKVSESSRTKGYEECVSAGVDERGLYSWFEKLTIWELQNRESSPELSAVKRAIASCLPRPKDSSDVQVDYDLERKELVLAYTDAMEVYHRDPLHFMSDGYRNTLSLVADIARRMATLNPVLLDRVLETPGIILIDEVDLHLHPLWQARILSDLRHTFPNVQFIVSTHAPIVVSSVGRRHLRLLGFDSAFYPSEETYGRDANSIISFVMGGTKRPLEIEGYFRAFYDLLDAENFVGAESVLDEIEGQIGQDDSELVSARTALFLERDE